MPARTGAEYIAGLRDSRPTLYMQGERKCSHAPDTSVCSSYVSPPCPTEEPQSNAQVISRKGLDWEQRDLVVLQRSRVTSRSVLALLSMCNGAVKPLCDGPG